MPAAVPLDDAHSWAVVLTESDDGHVSDEDAASTDYPKLLKQMQQETEDENAERTKAGYSALHLVGWAEPPHYDSANKKLYWARELAADGGAQHSLNYDIRVLGRSGYLSMASRGSSPANCASRQRTPCCCAAPRSTRRCCGASSPRISVKATKCAGTPPGARCSANASNASMASCSGRNRRVAQTRRSPRAR